MDQEDRLEALDEHLHQATEGLDRVRDSVAQLDARLRELTEAQEGIELQLALLSKEAEQYDSWLRLSDPDSEFSHRQRSENGKLYAIEQQVLALAESVEQLGGRQPTEVGVRDAPRHWANIESDLTEDRRRIDLLLTRIDALEAEVADAQLAVADVDSRLLGGDVSAPESADPSGTPNAAVTHALDAVVGDRPHRVHHDIHALKVAGGMLLDRLSTLEQQRRQLKSSISAIGVEQARRDEESLQLRRQLRRRSLVSGLALVLASVSVFVVFQQGLLKAADERVAEVEPVVTTSMVPAVDDDLRAAVADVRDDMVLFDTSLAALAESVDQLAMAPQPQRDSVLEDVQRSLSQLAADDVQLREELAEIRREQDTIEDAVARIIAPRSNVPVVSVAQDLPVSDEAGNMPKATAVEPEQLEPELTKPKLVEPEQVTQASVEPERTERVFAVFPMDKDLEADWEAARSTGGYTLQLMGVSKPVLINEALQRYELKGPHAVHHGTREGRDWFALLHGIYESSAEAQAAIAELPSELSAKRPWIRQVPSRGRLETR